MSGFTLRMSINVHRGADVGMSEQFLNILWIGTLIKEIGSIGMPKRVEMKMVDS